ncbi:hypothetical protein MPSI1_003486 [Malassezia psittaci]|uniref:Protein CASP n=1 Tax=Malassezia psittaci TaxID=1821823 RepID=A0AAF0F9J1_9BASI|nr:hypothetical protein MPSI1_003486 [Malassezia psittaci]
MPDFSSVLESWRGVRWDALQSELANYVPEFSKKQQDALVSRKQLADRTREFKRQSPETQREEIRALLKAYQSEVDQLSNRAKYAEGVLLDISSRLRNVSDPFPAFELLIDHTATVHDQEQLHAKLKTVQEQCTALQQRCAAAEAHVAESGQREAEAASEAAAQFASAQADAERRASNREASLRQEIHSLQDHLRELRTNHEQVLSQLLETQSISSQSESVRNPNYTLVQQIQQANERAEASERRLNELRIEFEQARNEEAAVYAQHLERLRSQINELESTQARERESAAQVQHTAQQAQQAEHDRYTKEVEALEGRIAHLQSSLAQYSDYNELKRELNVLKAIELAGEDEQQGESTALESTSTLATSLETHLVKRNRTLQDEVATLRANATDTNRHIQRLETDLKQEKDRVQQLEVLSKRLETDLLGVAETPAADAAETPNANSAGLLPIVTKQRDRFRERNTELERELRMQVELITKLRGESRKLQEDNVAMYEKVRYLQNYRESNSSEQPYPMQTRRHVETPYQARYEQSINPFEAFRGQEQSRAIAKLSPVDRLLHLFTRAVLSDPRMRLGFVCYAVLLHLMIFGILLDAGHRAVEGQ